MFSAIGGGIFQLSLIEFVEFQLQTFGEKVVLEGDTILRPVMNWQRVIHSILGHTLGIIRVRPRAQSGIQLGQGFVGVRTRVITFHHIRVETQNRILDPEDR